MAKRRKSTRVETPSRDVKSTVLMGIAAAIGLLAIFQWYELISILEGNTTFCSINESLDCEAVWNSDFAKSIHRATKLPVAAWGLVYAFAALAAAHRFHRLRRAGKKEAEPIWAVRFVAAVGLVISLVLLIASWAIGTFCLTCMITYTLVIAYAVIAFRVPSPRPLSQTKPGRIVAVPALYVVLGWVLLLWPGSATPIEIETHLPPPIVEQAKKKSELELYVDGLPSAVQQGISDSLEQMRKSPRVPKRTPRKVHGPAGAPVHILDFSDVRCGHCRQLEKIMHDLERTLPPGSFSHESRFFPLDGSCNKNLSKDMVDDTGVRCLGPRILVCLEQNEGYSRARSRIFEEQNNLTVDLLYEIATAESGTSRADLEKCAASAETKQKIEDDIAYAMEYGLEGTPLVVVNGRTGSSLPPFLYAIVLAGGDPNHPAFANLPPPRPPHHGHMH
jgi:serine/threonine-protein kinase